MLRCLIISRHLRNRGPATGLASFGIVIPLLETRLRIALILGALGLVGLGKMGFNMRARLRESGHQDSRLLIHPLKARWAAAGRWTGWPTRGPRHGWLG